MFALARLKYAEIEYGYPSVVTPRVASARSTPLSFTTMPMISGSAVPAGREALSASITASLSAICRTCCGETKLTASMCGTSLDQRPKIRGLRFGRNLPRQPLPGVARALYDFHAIHSGRVII